MFWIHEVLTDMHQEAKEVLKDYLKNITADVKDDENQFIRRSDWLGGERLMWLTRDMADLNNEDKSHIELTNTLM
jgi:hypothetical protein